MQNFEIELDKRIQYSLDNKNIEFEVIFKNNNSLNLILKLIKRFKTLNYVMENDGSEELDIFIDNNPLRITLNKEEMLKLCKTDSFLEDNVKNIVYKSKLSDIKSLNNNDFNFYVNLKKEINYKDVKEDITDYLNNFLDKNKFKNSRKRYRFKKRYSFKTNDNLFRIDLTIVKQADGYNIINSDLLNSNNKYEIEIEYIGKNNIDKDIFKRILKINIGYILQVVQDSYYLIKNKESNAVRDVYNKLIYDILRYRTSQNLKEIESFIREIKEDRYKLDVYLKDKPIFLKDFYDNIVKLKPDDLRRTLVYKLNSAKFFLKKRIDYYKNTDFDEQLSKIRGIGPKPATLEMNNLYKDESINILKNYTVTDKAEGEAKILYILGLDHLSSNDKARYKHLEGKVYLIDNKSIIYTGIIQNSYLKNTIVNGEFMKVNKRNEIINLYLAYDLYYLADRDLSDKPLYHKDNRNRLDELKRMVNDFELKSNIKFDIKVKDFYIQDEKNIFELSNIVLENDYDYKLDGLIFTPANTPVGYDKVYYKKMKDVKINFYNLSLTSVWLSNLKWKSAEDNSIDFKIDIQKENVNGIKKDLIKLDYNDNSIRYKTIHLYCGNKLNRFSPYKNIPFVPSSFNIDRNIHIVDLEIDETNNIIGLWDNMPLQNHSIVEFKYDVENKKWIPLRTRYDKMAVESKSLEDKPYGNDFKTANQIWLGMHKPITEHTIKTGKDIMKKEEYYFDKDISEFREDSDMINLRKFHNKIKAFKLKQTVENIRKNKKNVSLLEIACGKAQDLYKWCDNNINNIVGIDIFETNIEGVVDSANTRYNKMSLVKKNLWDHNITFLVGDCRKLIKTYEAFELERYQKKAELVFQNKFDIISIQFAVHYFFESISTIQNIVNNINDNLNLNGYLIGCCFDGKKILELFKKNNLKQNENVKTSLWNIEKLFSDDNVSDMENIKDKNEYKIKVYIDSIGKTNAEYLVNFDYFIRLLDEKGIRLVSLESFSEFNNIERKLKNPLIDDEKQFSYLNNYYVFQKVFEHDVETNETNFSKISGTTNFTNKTGFTNITKDTKQSTNKTNKTTETQDSTLNKIKEKMRKCLNTLNEFFEDYERYLTGKRIVIETDDSDLSSGNSSKTQKKYIWEYFKKKCNKTTLNAIKLCIKDLNIYKKDKNKYEILDYDIQLLNIYENYLKDIESKLKTKTNLKLTSQEIKNNKQIIQNQLLDLLTILLIECYEDYKKNSKNLLKTKFYIVNKIDNLNLETLQKLFKKRKNVEIINKLKEKSYNYDLIKEQFLNFLVDFKKYKDTNIIDNDSIEIEDKYNIIIEKLLKLFSDFDTYLENKELIKLDSLEIIKQAKFVISSINFLNKIKDKDFVDIDLIENLNKQYSNLRNEIKLTQINSKE